MRRSSVILRRFLVLAGACCAALLLWPTEAAAQRRGRPVIVRRPGTSVVVGVGFGYGYSPFYRPYYYSPLFYGGPSVLFFFAWCPWYDGYGVQNPGPARGL